MSLENDIMTLVLKHPFFRNPNNYYIRRITLIKFLKKKGIDVNTENFSEEFDLIMRKIPGVSKASLDGYSYKKD